jgi:uronate dehydrogenase
VVSGGTVLLTGAAGGVGTFLRRGLPALGWKLRCYDRRPILDDPDAVTADIRDPVALAAAMDGVDAVVHLAGIPTEDTFDRIRDANIDGSYRVFEAARAAGVGRVVYASSNHAVGFLPRQELAPVAVPPRPDTFYGLSKAFGEALGQLYADRHGMAVACLRIGSCFQRPTSTRQLSTWLSPADCVRLVHACLTAPDLGYAVVYGVSANTRGWWDLEPARRLGYAPADDAEVYAAAVLAEHGELDPADPDHAYLGGRFTVAVPPERR